jgi:hypothetical protein
MQLPQGAPDLPALVACTWPVYCMYMAMFSECVCSVHQVSTPYVVPSAGFGHHYLGKME